MCTFEDRIRADIESKYGSIPKMARVIGVPPTTIYHALERGIENTTTKTRNRILEPLYGAQSVSELFAKIDSADNGEQKLLEIYRTLDDDLRRTLLNVAKALLP